MSLPDGLTLRDAELADVPEILGLRRDVGWAAHEWALRLAIAPENARCVVVQDAGGRIVAVGSGVSYGAVGYVGNMIVAEGHRRRGLGSAVLAAVTEFLERSGATRLELYATHDGRPLYARHGFEFMEPGSRVEIPRTVDLEPALGVTVTADDASVEELLAYDAPRFGGPRTALLHAMLHDTDRPLLVARRDGALAGFGWLRAEDARIGPWVSDDPEVAAAIAADALARLPEQPSVTANVPMSNRPAVAWLDRLGVVPDPWDGRMARGEPIGRRDDTIYGNTVGALG